jgi:hypothetical protein
MVLACLLAPLASSAQKPPDAAVQELPVPADLVEPLARSSGIGRLLYVLDRVAAIGTDALLAEVPDPGRHGIAGYIPMQESEDDGTPKSSFLVSFYTGETPPRIAYTVRVAPGTKPVVDTFLPPKDTLPAFAAFVRARQLAMASADLSGQPLNPVLIPGEAIGEKGILVYLLAGTKKPDVVVLGRHTRVLVSEDGARVLAVTPLTKAVLEAPTRGSLAAVVVSQFATDYPVETHVFASLVSKLPIYVITERGTWRVNGEAIAFLGDQQPNKPDKKE